MAKIIPQQPTTAKSQGKNIAKQSWANNSPQTTMNPPHTIFDEVVEEITQIEMGKELTPNLYMRVKYTSHYHISAMNAQSIPLSKEERKTEKGEQSFCVNGRKRMSHTSNQCERGKGKPPHNGL